MTAKLDLYSTGQFTSMAKVLEELPELMVEFRQRHGLNHYSVNAAAHMPDGHWRKIEHGTFTPVLAEIQQILHLFANPPTNKDPHGPE